MYVYLHMYVYVDVDVFVFACVCFHALATSCAHDPNGARTSHHSVAILLESTQCSQRPEVCLNTNTYG